MSAPRFLARALPSLLVIALLFAAAAGMRSRSNGAAAAEVLCDPVVSATTDAYPIAELWGVTQPFDPTTNVQACSLRVYSNYNANTVQIIAWDSQANAPDPSTVVLRYFSFDPSAMAINHLRLDLGSRPIVTQRLGHLADPPRTRLAIDFSAPYPFGSAEYVYYDHAGPAAVPSAQEYPVASGARQPVAGPHPVLSYGVCAGDGASQALLLAQCVMTADAPLDTTWYELLQTFRVPATVTMQFAEFALDPPYSAPYPEVNGLLQVLDAAAGSPGVSAPLGQATFVNSYLPVPAWASHFDLDTRPTLVAGHPYELLLRGQHLYRFRARALTGAESSDFTDGIGTLYGRSGPQGAWTPIPGRALSMRIIGTPVGSVDAPQPPLAPGARLKLSLSPNPSRGPVFASWGGGSGRAIIDVLDARGRRVNGVTLPAAGRGDWLWNGTSADGRIAPPGLYFVRAHDDAGRSAVERVVVVR
jgi:hypothetical protein